MHQRNNSRLHSRNNSRIRLHSRNNSRLHSRNNTRLHCVQTCFSALKDMSTAGIANIMITMKTMKTMNMAKAHTIRHTQSITMIEIMGKKNV